MSNTPNIDYLKERVDTLKKLLDDPHPGMVSWASMYGKTMQEINDFWTAGDKNES